MIFTKQKIVSFAYMYVLSTEIRLFQSNNHHQLKVICTIILYLIPLLPYKKGQIMGRQHKMQLVPPDLENGMETYGEGLSVFTLNGTPISVIICHDNRFPELVRYGNMGCQFFKGGIQN